MSGIGRCAPAGRRVAIGLCLLSGGGVQAAEPPAALARVEQVRSLSADAAAGRHPVRLRGVVTFYNFDPKWNPLFVQDASGGIYVEVGSHDLKVRPGDLVEVEGHSGPGMFAPLVVPSAVRVLGRAPLPMPLKRTIHDLLEGAWDSQWVEVEGVLRAVTRSGLYVRLDLASQGRSFRCMVRAPDVAPLPLDLVDARVRVRGACGTFFTRNRQIVGVQLLVPGLEQVAAVRPAPGDPFAQPVRAMGQLLQFAAAGASEHRVHVRGTVTQVSGEGMVYLRDESGGLAATLAAPVVGLRAGDEVDAVGFAEHGEYSPRLQNAHLRVRRGGAAPPALAVGIERVLTGEYDSLPVRLQGLLLDNVPQGGGSLLVLKSGDSTFEAELPRGQAGVRSGSVVEVTGICRVRSGTQNRVEHVSVLVRDLDGIRVVTAPPWWTLRRALAAVGALLLLAAAGLAWNVSLRRHVRRALARVKVLSGLLPMCAWCRKIRDDRGYWSQVETYLQEHADTRVTHGICPDCQQQLRKADATLAAEADVARGQRRR
jgi:hypothetical protein